MTYSFETAYVIITVDAGHFEVDQICSTKSGARDLRDIANTEARDLRNMGFTVILCELPLTFSDDFATMVQEMVANGETMNRAKLQNMAKQTCIDLQADYDAGRMEQTETETKDQTMTQLTEKEIRAKIAALQAQLPKKQSKALQGTIDANQAGIIYEGPSQIDGKPIVVIATYSARNTKTGAFLQTYILRSDIDPRDASKSGEDFSICGDCPLRGDATADPKRKIAKNRRCYVVIGQGPVIAYKTYKRGRYAAVNGHKAIAALGRGRMVRLGCHGDPAAVPGYIWESLVSEAQGWTGYTHSGAKTGKAHNATLTMQTADSLKHAESFWAQGARTFRVIQDTSELVAGKEILCPASKEAGARVQCVTCKLCEGIGGKRANAKSIAIVEH